MKKLKELVEELKKTSQDTTPGGIMKEILKGQKVMSENYKTGNIWTAVREFMRSEEKAGRLKLNETDSFRIREYSPMNEDDPIDVFRRHYGEDALDAADAMADELRFGESFKHYEEIFRKNMPDLKVKVKGAGEYDDSVKAGEELRKLSEFDPGDRKPHAEGGLIDILKL